MSLIQQLQDDIVDEQVSLASVLLKAKILAYRLKHDEFKNWVNNELNGYSDGDDVPSYRRYPAYNYGDFRDSSGRLVENKPIPKINLPEHPRIDHIRKGFMQDSFFYEGVVALEDMRKREEIKISWHPMIIAIAARTEIYEGLNLEDAWTAFDASIIAEILGVVRSKLLTFVLELQEISPDLTESDDKIGEVPPERITYMYNTYIHGNQNVVAAGANITQDVRQVVRSNDPSSLLSYLQSIGVSEEDAQELKEAVEEDGPAEESAGFGPRVLAWLGQKTAEGALNATLSGIATTTAKAVAQYYGWLA